MNYKKLLFAIITLLFLSACTASKEGADEKNKTEIKVVDNFEIRFLTANQLTSEEGDILQLNFTVKNKSADTKAFDSFVFIAENNEEKKLEIAPKENFGNDLKPGETKEGSVYYYLQGSAPITVTYEDPESDTTETWVIKGIEK